MYKQAPSWAPRTLRARYTQPLEDAGHQEARAAGLSDMARPTTVAVQAERMVAVTHGQPLSNHSILQVPAGQQGTRYGLDPLLSAEMQQPRRQVKFYSRVTYLGEGNRLSASEYPVWETVTCAMESDWQDSHSSWGIQKGLRPT